MVPDHLLYHTYTQDKALDDKQGRTLGAVMNDNKIMALKREIEALEAKVGR